MIQRMDFREAMGHPPAKHEPDHSICLCPVPLHPCPFEMEVYHNDEDFCECCEKCETKCGEDI